MSEEWRPNNRWAFIDTIMTGNLQGFLEHAPPEDGVDIWLSIALLAEQFRCEFRGSKQYMDELIDHLLQHGASMDRAVAMYRESQFYRPSDAVERRMFHFCRFIDITEEE